MWLDVVDWLGLGMTQCHLLTLRGHQVMVLGGVQ
jgi:hypothetical protein